MTGSRKQLELDLADGEHKTVDVELDDLVTLTGRVVEKGTTTPVAGVRMMANPTGGPPRPFRPDDRPSLSDDRGRFTLRNVSRGKLTITGFPSSGPDGGYVRAERTVDGAGTLELGDLELEKRGR